MPKISLSVPPYVSHRWKMGGAGHVKKKPIAAPAGPIARPCSLAADKTCCGMPAAYSIFRKICHVIADSETWPNAAAVVRFSRNGRSVSEPLRKQDVSRWTKLRWSGSDRDLPLTVQSAKPAESSVRHLEVAIVDRTARLMAANEELRRRKEQLDGSFELSPDAVILTRRRFSRVAGQQGIHMNLRVHSRGGRRDSGFRTQ